MEKAETTDATSLGGRPVVILKGTPALERYPSASYRTLPHEIFHRVQHIYGANPKTAPAWFLEGTTEFFRYQAMDYAGLQTEQLNRKEALSRLAIQYERSKQSLMPLSSLLSYTEWENELAREESERKVPFRQIIYPYAALSVIRLTQDHFLKIAAVLKLMKAGENFDQAFQTIFNSTVSDFEQSMTNSLNAEIRETAKKVYGSRTGTSAPLHPKQSKPIGLGVKPTPQGFQVMYLVPGDTAEKAHIKVGDLVVAIDGHNVVGDFIRQFVVLLHQNPGSPLTLEILRNGQKMQLTIARPEP